MKQIQIAFKSLTVIALAVLAVGCTNTLKEKENLAAAAGFKAVAPSSPDQVAILKSLPREQVSPVDYEGKKYYVLPDATHNQAWVGGPKQYQAFRQLRLAKQISNNNLQAAQMNQMSAMNWGRWNNWGHWNRRWY